MSRLLPYLNLSLLLALLLLNFPANATGPIDPPIALGERPAQLVAGLPEGELKTSLQECAGGPFQKSAFSIGHRGAPLHYPEHTRESYLAAARQGAGKLECDAVLTRDGELVCRHAACDLHTTTNILAIPELAKHCREPFQAARIDPDTGHLAMAASARCCASDLASHEFLSLRGKRDSANNRATTVSEYMSDWESSVAPEKQGGTLMTHRQSIRLFAELGVDMVPELKAAETGLPEGVSQADYAKQLVEDYRAANISADHVGLQSFNLEDVLSWIEHAPEFGRRAIYLDGRYEQGNFDHRDPTTWEPGMKELKNMGVHTIAPPLWVLLDNDSGEIVPSLYALKAREAGLGIITWTLERSKSMEKGGGWYYRSIRPLISSDSDSLRALDVLAQEVRVKGVFSDWPATVTYYANCMGL